MRANYAVNSATFRIPISTGRFSCISPISCSSSTSSAMPISRSNTTLLLLLIRNTIKKLTMSNRIIERPNKAIKFLHPRQSPQFISSLYTRVFLFSIQYLNRVNNIFVRLSLYYSIIFVWTNRIFFSNISS